MTIRYIFFSLSQVATIFVGLSVLTSLLTISSLIMMFFMKSTTVFHICGWMQILSGKLSIAILSFVTDCFIYFYIITIIILSLD